MASIAREKETIRTMIGLFCRGNHRTQETLCEDCRDLLAYAEKRLERCPHAVKPACKDCAVHCYAPDKRKAIQTVMRYAGPRLLLRNPAAALAHLLRRRPPKRQGKKP